METVVDERSVKNKIAMMATTNLEYHLVGYRSSEEMSMLVWPFSALIWYFVNHDSIANNVPKRNILPISADNPPRSHLRNRSRTNFDLSQKMLA
jgi:hypothetical protein